MAITCELKGEGGAGLTLSYGRRMPEDWVECAVAVVTERGTRWDSDDVAMPAKDLHELVRFGRGEPSELGPAVGFESSMDGFFLARKEVGDRVVVLGSVESNSSALRDDDDDYVSDGVNFRIPVTEAALTRFADEVEAAAKELRLWDAED